MKTKAFTVCALMAVLLIGSASSAVQITATGTAQTTSYGYTAGQSYTLTIEFSDSFSGNFMAGEDLFLPGYGNVWVDNDSSSLYTSASGTALSGSGSLNMAQHVLMTTGSNWLTVLVDNLEGLTMLDGTAVDEIDAGEGFLWQLDGISFAPLATEVDPVTYFEQYAGTYNCLGGIWRLGDATGYGEDSMVFDVTSVTITPEPATMALLGLGGLFIRRRKA